MLYGVIMAGGSGERFWPRSRRALPKQLLPLGGERTMLQETVERVSPLIPPERTLVVTGRLLEEEVRRQLPGLPTANVIAEPVGRNTAPCIGLAAVILRKRDPEAVMAVLPSDHVIGDRDAFLKVLGNAAGCADRTGCLLTLGIRPTFPSTGYGYIRFGAPLPGDRASARRVEAFVEKPDRRKAEAFLKEGCYLWNSGMFLWRADAILEALRTHLPALAERLSDIGEALGSSGEGRVIENAYPEMEKVSIDYGVMEKAGNALVIEGDFAWDDVGSWTALTKYGEGDGDGNTVFAGTHVGVESRGCLIHAEGHVVATVGVSDLVIVRHGDAVLVCAKAMEQRVKEVVALLEKRGERGLL